MICAVIEANIERWEMSVCDYKIEREDGLRVHVCTFLSTDWFIVRNCHSTFMMYKE